MTPANDRGRKAEGPINKQQENARYAGYMAAIAKTQDKDSFRALYAHFAPRIKTYLLGLKIQQNHADDLVQEVFLIVWRKAALYKPERAFVSTWIFTIARNKFIDGKRKEGRFPADDLIYQEELRETETGEGAFVRKETKGRVQKAMKALPDDQKMVIRKAFLEGKTHTEVAEETGLALGTVKSRIRLAFEKMRKELE